jgi:hypothetical protein
MIESVAGPIVVLEPDHVVGTADDVLLAGAGQRGHRAVRQPDAAQQVVGRVGDDDVVVHRRRQLRGDEAQAVRLGEPGLVGPAVGPAALAGPDPPDERLPVRLELGERVVPGVGDKEVAVRQRHRLRGEAQRPGRRLGRHVRPVAASQRALRAVLVDQPLDQGGQGRTVPLPGQVRDDVALRVDDD